MTFLLKYKYYVFIVISFILYGNTIQNNYSIDDDYVTEKNITTKGLASIYTIFTTHYAIGDDGKGFDYRPMVKFSFALEHEFFGVNPHISHFINIILYSICLILLFKVLILIFSSEKSEFILLTVLIFASLPIHTEVVASLKNRDILLCFIFSFFSYTILHKYQTRKKIHFLFLGITFMFLAFLSKLDALPLLLIFPIIILSGDKLNSKKILVTLSICLIIFFGSKIFQNIMLEHNTTKRIYSLYENPLYINKNLNDKLSASLNCLGFYVKSLSIPTNLCSYYGYNTIPIKDFLSTFSILGIISGILIIVGLFKYYKTPKHPIFIGILFFTCSISMYLNFVRPVPGIVADRFAFFSSVGFTIIISYLIYYFADKSIKKFNLKTTGIYLIIFITFSTLTISRNKEWYDRSTLLKYDIKKYPTSVKLNVLYANDLISQTNKNRTSVDQSLKNINLAKAYLIKAYQIDSSYYNITNSLGFISLSYLNNPQEAISYFYKSLKNKPYDFEINLNLGLCYERLVKKDSAEKYFIKAYSIKPKSKPLEIYLKNYFINSNQSPKFKKMYPNSQEISFKGH